jgi:hypothetical protein
LKPLKLKTRALSVCLACLIVFSYAASGAIINDLYDARIEVADQSQVIREKAIQQAFRQVLIKVSGQSNLLSNRQVSTKLSEAIRFMHAYSYEMQDQQLFVRVDFDPQRVEKMLRSSGVPVWDKRRPDTLIWLASEEIGGSRRRIVKGGEYYDLLQLTEQSAATRGIKLIHPLWDLDDFEKLSLYDLWGGFSQQIIMASERYDTEIVFSARLYQENDSRVGNTDTNRAWYADWIMVDNGSMVSGRETAGSQDTLVELLIDMLADNLAAEYAIDLTKLDPDAAKSQIKITNVDSLVKYVQVLKFLNSLSVVSSASLVQQKGPEAIFQLSLLGDTNDLINALALDNKIQPVLNEYGQAKQGLEFIWNSNE